MANYMALVRSNYIKVKDVSAWKAFCKRWGLTPIEDSQKRQGFTGEELEDGLRTDYVLDQETGEEKEADFFKEISQELASGQVAIIIQIGWEKMRYLTGWAWAINSKGVNKRSDLSDIYKVAEKMAHSGEITLAEY